MDKNVTTFRIIGAILGIVILAGAYFIAMGMVNRERPIKVKEDFDNTRQVEVMPAKNTDIPSNLEVQGALVAFDKIDIFAEVSGTLLNTKRTFKVGSYFPKGSTLIKVDQTEAKLNLLSQKSTLLNAITQLMPDLKIDYPQSFQNWKNYLDQFDVEQPLRPFPEAVSDQEKYFIASRNLYTQYYSIQSIEERLSKYELKAPFGGVITQSSIHPGALVRVGQKLGELMNTGNYELEVTVPLADLKYIKTGNTVNLYSDDIDGKWSGKIKRINDQVETNTQTVKLFVSVSGKNLREGMYMRGEIAGSSIQDALLLPKDLLVNQNSLYVVNDTLLNAIPVDVVKITESGAIVRGVEDGTLLLKNLFPGAYDGMRVSVNEQVSIAQ
ncbi:MAG: HlyD family efflux transporter periplasmic adaptor subunit [Bacteroidota bacterium]